MRVGMARLVTFAAVAALVAVAGSTGAWATECSATVPTFSPDFSANQTCLTLNGNYADNASSLYPAFTSPAPPPAASAPANVNTVLRLTPNVGGWATSAWFNTSQLVSNGFSTTFTFQISDTTAYNADGFAFLVQNSSLNALGYRGCGVGFGYDPSGYGCSLSSTSSGIPNSVAIQFKTYDDGYPSEYPNTANSVSIMSNGTNANCIAYACAVAANNSLQIAGAVSTSGTTVTWSSGSQFNPSWTAGTAILINGVSYSIASVVSTTQLTVSTAPPTYLPSTPVPFSVGAPVVGAVTTTGTTTVTWVSGSLFNTKWDPGTQILINGTAYTISSVSSTTSLTLTQAAPSMSGVPYSVGTILDDGNIHTVTISYTPTPSAATSPNCIVEGTAEPCIDVILDGVDLFNGGVIFNIATQLSLASGTNAYVGFTAGNAGGNDDEDILSWTFAPQAQSQTSTVTPTSPATYTYNGGCNPNESGCTTSGYNNAVSENPASSQTIQNMVVTPIPIIAGDGSVPALNQAACNAIVDAINPNTGSSPFVNAGPPAQTAQCFVYENAYVDSKGTSYDAPVLFSVTCPSTGGVCDSPGAPFYAALTSYFNFTCAENSPLSPANCSPSLPGNFGSFTSPYGPTSTTGLAAVGFLQGAGPDPNNPCTPATGTGALPLFQSNQIVSSTLGDTSISPSKGGSGPLTSCWVVTYDTPGEIPTATVNSINNNPVTSGASYAQNATVSASFSCSAVSTDQYSILDPNGYPTTGPYLTVSSCNATSGPTAGGGTPTDGSCAPVITDPVSSPLDSCSGTISLDTSEGGAHTLTVDVEDSAMNTAQQQVTYNVVPPQTIGGNISGLLGSGLVLQDNGGDNVSPLASSTTFTFPTAIASGGGYSVTIYSQPTSPSQTCTVTGGSGAVATGPVTNVSVSCVTNTYTLSGTISGLTGSGLVLQDNSGNNQTPAASATAFSFGSIASGSPYSITVLTQPSSPSQTCTVTSGSGTITSAAVTNVSVVCTTNTYALSGTISGLTGSGLVLQDNSGNNQTPAASATAFSFGSIASGSPYSITVLTQPSSPSQTCTVTGGSGTITSAAVTNVAVVCTTNTYTLSGTISGLTGSGLVLQDNSGNNQTPAGNATTFSFGSIASGSPYAVTVLTQPSSPSQTCVVSNSSGTITSAAVTNVSVVCTTNTYALSGTISGLTGSGLVLQDNGVTSLPVAANATAFSFGLIASGSPYAVTVFTQPGTPSQTCVVSTGSGTITNVAVTSVKVTCTTNSYVLTTAVSPSGGGTVSPASGNSYTWGTSVPLVATPAAGYVFSSWTASPTAVAKANSASTSVTMTAPESVTANFVSALTVTPTLNFGTVLQGSITTLNATVTNSGTTPITMTTPFISIVEGQSSAFVVVSLCPKSLAGGGSCKISVTFAAGAYYSQQTAYLNVMDNAPGNPQKVTLTALVIDPRASFSPTSLNFGMVKHATSSTLDVTLSNPGATPLIFSGSGISVTGTNAADFVQSNNCGSSLAAGGKCTIAVKFTPPTTGSFSANLTVTDNACEGTQTVALSGKGD